MLFSFGLFYFWHKRNGGGGWNVAPFCFCGMVGLLLFSGKQCAMWDNFARSVTEKNNCGMLWGSLEKTKQALNASF
ncbi:MAG: hypothetical protein WCP69_04875 [Bacteroidota bacterium]